MMHSDALKRIRELEVSRDLYQALADQYMAALEHADMRETQAFSAGYDAGWNDAIDAALSAVPHDGEWDNPDNITWVDDRPYICEETVYRKIEELRR